MKPPMRRANTSQRTQCENHGHILSFLCKMHIFTHNFARGFMFGCVSLSFLVERLRYILIFQCIFSLCLSCVHGEGNHAKYTGVWDINLCRGSQSNLPFFYLEHFPALTLPNIKSQEAQLKVWDKYSNTDNTEFDSLILIIKKIIWLISSVSCSQSLALPSAMSGLFSA